MRVFIAVEFKPEIKKYLNEVGENVKKLSRRGNFTSENNFHLTVRFIGEIPREELSYVSEAVGEAALRSHAFELRLDNLGFFPRGKRAIVWVGTKENNELQKLFANVEKSLQKQGFSREKRGLKPHITLGREIELTESFDAVKEKIGIEELSISVDKVSVMESLRVDGKLVYRMVSAFNLRPNRSAKGAESCEDF